MIPQLYLLAVRSTLLAFEAQQVIALRMLRLAGGGKKAERELKRMFLEKAEATAETATKALTGIATGKSSTVVANRTVRSYRTRVRRNRRRLA